MVSRRDIVIRLKRVLHDLGSLGSAVAIVMAVLAFAVASIGSGAQAPVTAPSAGSTAQGASKVGSVDKTAQLYLDAQGLTGPPIVYAAEVDLQRWEGEDERIVEALVTRADPVDQATPVVDEHAPSVSVAKQLSERLKGRRVLAAVAPQTAKRLKLPGAATVRLVVTPQGETATLLIDGVVGPGQTPEEMLAEAGSAVTVARVNESPASPVAAVRVTPAASTAPRPVVSSLSHYFGRPGTLVTIEGQGFGRASTTRWVTCGGVKATWRSWSSTSITFVVPSGMKKSGYVGVVTAAGTSNGLYYIPFDPPVVTSMTPREGAPGTVVTITGSSFGSTQGTGWVTFAGRSAEVQSWTDTKIRVVIPKGAEAGYAGVVAHGLVSNGTLYGPYGMPFIGTISSRSIYPGMQITLNGRDFGAASGRVVCGGAWVTPDSWSPTQVTFTVPAAAASGYIGVVRPDGVGSNGMWEFVVPRLDSLSHWWASPGSTLTLTGAFFGNSQGSRSVYLGNRALPVLTWSDTRITLQLPEDAVTGAVSVGTGTVRSRPIYLLVETRADIDSVSPRQLAPGDQFTIAGTGFGVQQPTSSVRIAGVNQCLIVEWSDTRIVAIVPPGATSGYVGVIKRGVTSNGVWVNVLP